MREIKFRAWDKQKKIIRDVVLFGEAHKSGQFELMQYTGLKDKNGKEIYEGDIVHETWYKLGDKRLGLADGINRVIEWEVRKESGQYESYDPGFVGFEGFPASNFYEVIGNIYENKELLKCN